ncbi:MAG: hypothetical protein GY708_22270 [Actinomycetia bacterium]|nr:hypothetical protein [Actinomycetes bacterium]MCP4959743.1 hypothetical protein [Actinomycetes bacterium]
MTSTDTSEPTWSKYAHFAAISFLLLELAVGIVFRNADHLHDKGMVMRAVFYPLCIAAVPAGWVFRRKPQPFPHLAAALLILPFGLDIGGNLVGLFDVDHFDDVLHATNWFFLVLGTSTLVLRTREPLLAVFAIGVGTSATAIVLWEFVEYLVLKSGTTGLDLTYEDTVTDLMESWLGGVAGAALATYTRWRTLVRTTPRGR